MTAPKVSVIIPVYNGERYLGECLDSVLAQTLSDFELIAVDDGSTDSTPELLRGYAARDGRIRIVRLGHSNAGRCRNVGLAQARGEYLSFLDADDTFGRRFLETLVRLIEDGEADIAVSGKVDSSCAWNKMFRASFVRARGLEFLEQPSTNDFTFVLAALTEAKKIAATSEEFVNHRYHAASIQATRHKSPLFFFSAVSAYLKRYDSLSPRFAAYYLEHVFWQLGALRTREAYDEFYRGVIEFEREIGLLKLPRFERLLPRHRMMRYAGIIRGSLRARLWAAAERWLAPHTGGYELSRGVRRFLMRSARWSLALVFDPLLLWAKLREKECLRDVPAEGRI